MQHELGGAFDRRERARTDDSESDGESRFALGTRELDPLPPWIEARPRRAHGDGLRDDDIAQIVHDLKSPISTIALDTCLLEHRLGDVDDPEVRSSIHRIERNVGFLDRMVQDLLDLCAIDTGELVLRRRDTELRTLLEHTVDRIVAARDRDRVVLDAPVTVTISIDDLRIERVIANLLHNAIKYAEPPASIVIALEVTPRACVVSVSDAGPGIAAPEVARVFDKYRRASTSEGREGSGLGLYVSKRIVELHGGKIGVESVRDQGSRFYFELPRG